MEKIFSFTNKGSMMFGIIHEPDAPSEVARKKLGVVILHAGRQARRGPHKLYVKVARSLCQNGFTVLRYDNRGYGDSEGSEDLTLYDWYSDACCAIDVFMKTSNIDGIVIWGLCGGSVLSVHYAAEHPSKVDSLILCNLIYQYGQVNFKGQFKATYRKLLTPSFWSKALFTSPLFYFKKSVPHFKKFFLKAFFPNQLDTSFEASAVHYVRTLPKAFKKANKPTNFIFSALDPHVGDVNVDLIGNPVWKKHLSKIQTKFDLIEDADHNFSSVELETIVLKKTTDWAVERTLISDQN